MPYRYEHHPLPLSDIRLTDPFWGAWQKAFARHGVRHQWEQITSTDRLENFLRVTRSQGEKHKGCVFDDSDVYKWIEAASYALTVDPDCGLEPLVNEAIAAIAAAQEPDGYLSTAHQLDWPDKRWRNLSMAHEMYCLGHLIEGAVAHFQATGKRDLLDVAIRATDNAASVFGPGKRKGYCGHEEFELALVALSTATGDPKYRELARWMIDNRGTRPSPFQEELGDPESVAMHPYGKAMLMRGDVYDGAYCQDDKPLREQTTAVGHSVRAMYYYCGAADAYGDGSDPSVAVALQRIWDSLVNRRMYVTGGIGSSGANEGFTDDFDLPNLDAYAETCAGIGLILWAWRMNRMTGDSSTVDVLERTLYNAVLSGAGFDGDTYFYENPLESRGKHLRQQWFLCSCCPPNVARLILSLGRYVVGVGDDALWVNVPVACSGTTTIQGVRVAFEVESEYPWEGTFKVRLNPERPVRFSLRLRQPGWANSVDITFGSKSANFNMDRGYLVVDKEWKAGDEVTLEVPTDPVWLGCDPQVVGNAGRAALARGPLIYCLEEADLGAPVSRFVADASAEPEVVVENDPRLARSITVKGTVDNWTFPSTYRAGGSPQRKPTAARFVPYFAWANREPGSMQVWVRR